jgi:hypothetical protein
MDIYKVKAFHAFAGLVLVAIITHTSLRECCVYTRILQMHILTQIRIYIHAGKLGHGSHSHEYEPRRVQQASGIHMQSLACGPTWTTAMVSEAEAFVWGELDYGHGHLQFVKL